MNTKLTTMLALLIAMALILSACGGGQESPEAPAPPEAQAPVEEPSEPTTLNIGTTYIWDTANPLISWYGYGIKYLTFSTLTQWAGLDSFQPDLAESWTVSDDGLVWTFKIREGVTFHDGTPCTTEDIAWSFNWIIENDWETIGFYLYNFEEVVALDETTVQITLASPVGNMVSALLISTWVMPRSVWEGLSYDEAVELEGVLASTGTGPYKLVEWVEGEYLILEAFDDYYGGRPPFDRIVYREYATEDALVQALLAGEVDDIYVPPTAVDTLQDAEGIHLAIMPSFSIDELIINSHENGTQAESLNDPTVRLAMAYAIDKQSIVNVGYLGYAEPATVVAPTAMGDYHNSSVEDIPFDIAEGNRILEEAGYVDSDGDGIREDLEGNPLEYRFYSYEDAKQARVMEIVADGLLQIGISAPPVLMDEDSLLALYPAYDFDLIYWDWDLDVDPDFAMLIMTCDERQEYGWNDSGYCDEEFDEWYYEQSVTVDREARKEILWKMQEKLFNDRPYIMFTYYMTIEAARTDKFMPIEECGDFTWKWCLLQSTVTK